MRMYPALIAVVIAGMLAACSADDEAAPVLAPERAPVPESTIDTGPTSMEGASCAVVPTDIEFGSWEHSSRVHDCLRELAFGDWPKARAEAVHVVTWGIAGAELGELIATLSNFDSAAAVADTMRNYGLLDGDGEPGILEYYGESWKPLTGFDWLIKAGNQYNFDAETGMHPNHHDSLLYELAGLFGDALADATFAEDAPHWESDEPYQLHATLGDREWKRAATNYGDWYDVSTVLDLLNEMAAAIGSPDRIMPLETGDQTVMVVVGPGRSLISAAADGLIRPAGAAESMERGKAFEEEVLRRYRIQAD